MENYNHPNDLRSGEKTVIDTFFILSNDKINDIINPIWKQGSGIAGNQQD